MKVFKNIIFKLKIFPILLFTFLFIGSASKAYAQGEWRMLGKIDSHASSWIYSMVKDHSGNIYTAAAHGVFKYDGTNWSELGAYGNGLNSYTPWPAQDPVRKVAVDNLGNVYSSFDSTDGEWQVAKFNGTSWTRLPSPGSFGYAITSLVTDPAGNLFESHNDGTIYKWNGAAWTTILGTSGYPIYSMVCDGTGKLYTTGNAPISGQYWVHLWDGVSWTSLTTGAGFGNTYGALVTDELDNVYATVHYGNTTHVGVTKWNGTTWTELGTGISAPNIYEQFLTIAMDEQHNIYAAGTLENSSGKKIVAKWNGSSWSELGSGMNGLSSRYDVHALITDQAGNICATLDNNDGLAEDSCYIAKWNGTNWNDELGATNAASDLYWPVRNLAAGTNVLYAVTAGAAINNPSPFPLPSAGPASIVKWDGTAFSEYISAANTTGVGMLYSDANSNLYTTGSWLNANGKRYVAKWNGSAWLEMGSGTSALNANAEIESVIFDQQNNAYAAGSFTNASGKYYVAKWNGSTWAELGSGATALNANANIYTLAHDQDGNVYAAGAFTNASGKYYVTKWNGTSWTELGTGSASLNADNIIGNVVTDNAGNVYASGLAYLVKWNGTSWSQIGVASQFYSVLADAAGNVYASCYYLTGSQRPFSIMKWNGVTWSETGTVTDAFHDWNLSGGAYLARDPSGMIYAYAGTTNSREFYDILKLATAATGFYKFTGNGNWNVAANWEDNTIPPANLPAGSKIMISPANGGQCTLNTIQTILPGAIFTVSAGAHFVVTGNLINNQ